MLETGPKLKLCVQPLRNSVVMWIFSHGSFLVLSGRSLAVMNLPVSGVVPL